jgi:hypothetical protein
MKTTLIIDDSIMQRLRQEAVAQRRTISALVESALRLMLEGEPTAAELPPLPSFDSGGAYVDVSNREALYDRMEER